MKRKQLRLVGLGLVLGSGLGLGAAEPEACGGRGDADGPALADVLDVALAEAVVLAERDGAGRLVSETLVPSVLFTLWLTPLGAEAAGRMVVAAPFSIEGPLPLSSTYPPAPSATDKAAPTTIARRRGRLLAPPCAERPGGLRRSRRREAGCCPRASGGSGCHTAFMAGP